MEKQWPQLNSGYIRTRATSDLKTRPLRSAYIRSSRNTQIGINFMLTVYPSKQKDWVLDLKPLRTYMMHSMFSWVKGDTEPGRGPLGRKSKELVRWLSSSELQSRRGPWCGSQHLYQAVTTTFNSSSGGSEPSSWPPLASDTHVHANTQTDTPIHEWNLKLSLKNKKTKNIKNFFYILHVFYYWHV